MLAAAKFIGAGLACSGLIGAGLGIGVIFASLIASTSRNPEKAGQLFGYAILFRVRSSRSDRSFQFDDRFLNTLFLIIYNFFY